MSLLTNLPMGPLCGTSHDPLEGVGGVHTGGLIGAEILLKWKLFMTTITRTALRQRNMQCKIFERRGVLATARMAVLSVMITFGISAKASATPFSVDTSAIFVDSITDHVSIGTTTVGSTLLVNGTVTVSTGVFTATGNTQYSISTSSGIS